MAPPTPSPLPGTVVYPTTAPGFTYPPHAGKRVQHRLIAWNETDDFIGFQVIVEIENVGTEPIEIAALDSSYTVFAPDESVTTTGRFNTALPKWLAPGERGYLIAWELEEGLALEDFDHAEVSAGLIEGGAEPPQVTVGSLRARLVDEDLRVTGLVENKGTIDLEDVWAGAILFDTDGRILGAAVDVTVDELPAGERKGFTADGLNVPPIDPDAIAEMVGVAASWSFDRP